MWPVLKLNSQIHLMLSLATHTVLINNVILRYTDNFTKCSVVVSSPPVSTGYPGFESWPGNCLSSLWFSFKLLQRKFEPWNSSWSFYCTLSYIGTHNYPLLQHHITYTQSWASVEKCKHILCKLHFIHHLLSVYDGWWSERTRKQGQKKFSVWMTVPWFPAEAGFFCTANPIQTAIQLSTGVQGEAQHCCLYVTA